MRTKQLIPALAVAILSFSSALAQRVETELVDGCPVINCTDMPAAAFTTITKGDTEDQVTTAAANATVFHRFAVAKANAINADRGWALCLKACFDLGVGWRLPTQRELMLMKLLQTGLEKAAGFTALSYYSYASCTISISGSQRYFWSVEYLYGKTNSYILTAASRTRCVKEL